MAQERPNSSLNGYFHEPFPLVLVNSQILIISVFSGVLSLHFYVLIPMSSLHRSAFRGSLPSFRCPRSTVIDFRRHLPPRPHHFRHLHHVRHPRHFVLFVNPDILVVLVISAVILIIFVILVILVTYCSAAF